MKVTFFLKYILWDIWEQNKEKVKMDYISFYLFTFLELSIIFLK